MENNPTIIQALGEVPGLIEATKTIIEQNDKTNAIFAKALEHRAQAEIPIEEVQKVVRHVTEGVRQTRCAAPDVNEISDIIGQNVSKKTSQVLEDVVRETVRNTPIQLKHTHVHTTESSLLKLADDVSKNWILALSGVCILLIITIICTLLWYRNTERYWGNRYMKVYKSEYTTESEKKVLWEKAYPVDFLPSEFGTNPDYVKKKIQQNEVVLKERKREAKRHKGKWSAKVPIER